MDTTPAMNYASGGVQFPESQAALLRFPAHGN